MIKMPENCLGGDLFWWQEKSYIHTLITIPGEIGGRNGLGADTIQQPIITFALFDVAGILHATWQERPAKWQHIFIDSQAITERYNLGGKLEEGVLAVFISTLTELAPEITKEYSRLYSLLDWYSPQGELVSLHNDQSFRQRKLKTDFTEIIFNETVNEENYLVILNGPESQAANSIQLEIKNHLGVTQQAIYASPLSPFSLHKLYLHNLFSDLITFCDGKHATLRGRFDSQGLFTRPYVMTQGKYLSGYHGGDLYQWNNIPGFIYRYLGRGEINPMVALHNHELTTTINLLNTHGDLEEDFWVDARLYDEQGKLLAERERWVLAKRHQLTRGEIRDLLPQTNESFIGYIALNFSHDGKTFYPRRLQALLEYRTAQSTARVMAWSDIWNARQQVKTLFDQLGAHLNNFAGLGIKNPPADIKYQCFYRVWCSPSIISYVAITNCGTTPDYAQTITYRMKLEKNNGEYLLYEGKLPPHGTDYASIAKFFPTIHEFLGENSVAMAIVESEADLAVMHLSHHQISGVYSAEHFMHGSNYMDGKYYLPSGA